MSRFYSVASLGRRSLPNHWDLAAFAAILLIFVAIGRSFHGIAAPLPPTNAPPLPLDFATLPYLALRTTLRMFAALLASFIFTFTYATLAAKSRHAEVVLVPLLDILQSVPVFGFLTITVTFFLGLFPGNTLGAECAAVFAIFTAQAWNMAFSFYQSLHTIPRDLDEVARGFRFSGWQKFWQLEAPYAMPGLIWNTMMSMSGSWFFVVASEAITVGDTNIALPGIGSYIAVANIAGRWDAVFAAVVAMGVVILLYDQLLFRPVVAWAGKFRMELSVGQHTETSWVLNFLQRTYWLRVAMKPLFSILRTLGMLRIGFAPASRVKHLSASASRALDWVWIVIVIIGTIRALVSIFDYIQPVLNAAEIRLVFLGAFYTFLRVTVLILFASVVWVPVSVWIGLRPRWAAAVQPLAQFLAAFPVNTLYGVMVSLVLAFNLNPDIWLSGLIIFGTQWYIVFNVIAGAAAFPNDLREAAANFHIKGWQWWKNVILPGIAPYYVTGAITASGGSWNASVVAEILNWNNQTVKAHGLGSYIQYWTNHANDAGGFQREILGVAVMSIIVVIVNRVFWRRLYAYAENRFRL